MSRRFLAVLGLAFPLAMVTACGDASREGTTRGGFDTDWEESAGGNPSGGESSTGSDPGGGSSSGMGGDSEGDSGGSSGGGDDGSSGGAEPPPPDDGPTLDPPAGGSSGGSGGGAVQAELWETPSGVFYRMIAPAGPGPMPFLLVYSGTEGSQPMSINILNWGQATGTANMAVAVLHGVEYWGDTQAGIDVMEEVRSLYNIDNDRMYLMSESAGTTAGLALGLEVRQSWFAAYWANDVNTAAAPVRTAEELGFSPHGNSGPGGQFQLAGSIVDGMKSAGYRVADPAPYDGPGAGSHGDLDQLFAALSWFEGKSRQ